MRSFQCTSLQAASLFMQQCWRVCTPFSPPLVMSLAAKNPRHVKCVFVHDINYLSNKLCFSHHFRCRMLSISPLFAGRWKSIGTERDWISSPLSRVLRKQWVSHGRAGSPFQNRVYCAVQLQCCMHFWCKCSTCKWICRGWGFPLRVCASVRVRTVRWTHGLMWHSFRDSEDKTHSSSFFSTDREKVFGAEVAKVFAFSATHATSYVSQWRV